MTKALKAAMGKGEGKINRYGHVYPWIQIYFSVFNALHMREKAAASSPLPLNFRLSLGT